MRVYTRVPENSSIKYEYILEFSQNFSSIEYPSTRKFHALIKGLWVPAREAGGLRETLQQNKRDSAAPRVKKKEHHLGIYYLKTS